VARVAVLCPDLLFGSKVQGLLEAAGHQVWRLDTAEQARGAAPESDALVVDLTAEGIDGVEVLRALSGGGELEGVATIGFYAHVDQETRKRALDAGFDQVVPRSRMAREGAALVEAAVAETQR
jgi:CheY-like chemotaxis protein